jgi:hypothetical protein
MLKMVKSTNFMYVYHNKNDFERKIKDVFYMCTHIKFFVALGFELKALCLLGELPSELQC